VRRQTASSRNRTVSCRELNFTALQQNLRCKTFAPFMAAMKYIPARPPYGAADADAKSRLCRGSTPLRLGLASGKHPYPSVGVRPMLLIPSPRQHRAHLGHENMAPDGTDLPLYLDFRAFRDNLKLGNLVTGGGKCVFSGRAPDPPRLGRNGVGGRSSHACIQPRWGVFLLRRGARLPKTRMHCLLSHSSWKASNRSDRSPLDRPCASPHAVHHIGVAPECFSTAHARTGLRDVDALNMYGQLPPPGLGCCATETHATS